MARVPRTNLPRIEPRGVSTVMRSASGATAEAFGAGVARARTAENKALAATRLEEDRILAEVRANEDVAGAQITGAEGQLRAKTIGAESVVGAKARTGKAVARARGRGGIGVAEAEGEIKVAQATIAGAEVVARALGGAGETLFGIGQDLALASARIIRRQDSLDRRRIVSAVTGQLGELFAKEETEGSNFTAKGAAEAFKAQMEQVIAEAKKQHAAGQESQLLLAEALEKVSVLFGDEVSKVAVKALRAEESRLFEEHVAQGASEIGQSPGLLPEKLRDVEAYLQQLDPTSTPEEIATKRVAAYGAYGMAAFEYLYAAGEYKGAQKHLSKFAKFFSPEVTRRAQTRLTVANVETAREDVKRVALRRRIESYDIKITPRIALAMEGITLSREPQTLSEKMLEVERLVGPLDDAQRDKVANVYIDEKEGQRRSGGSKQAIALENINASLERYVRDDLDMAELVQFYSDYALATAVDPLSKERVEVPLVVKAAMAQKGFTEEMLRIPETALQFGMTLVEQMLLEQPDVVTVDPQVAEPDVAAPQADDLAQDSDLGEVFAGFLSDLLVGGKFIFELGPEFTGPLPAITDVLGRTPIFGTGSEAARVKASLPGLLRRLVDAIRKSPKFAERERESIEADFNLESKIWDNEPSYRDRMVGIYQTLLSYQTEIELALKKRMGIEQRRAEERALSTIKAFRLRLLPELLEASTRAELNKEVEQFEKDNPPGTLFTARDLSGQWQIYATGAGGEGATAQ